MTAQVTSAFGGPLVTLGAALPVEGDSSPATHALRIPASRGTLWARAAESAPAVFGKQEHYSSRISRAVYGRLEATRLIRASGTESDVRGPFALTRTAIDGSLRVSRQARGVIRAGVRVK